MVYLACAAGAVLDFEDVAVDVEVDVDDDVLWLFMIDGVVGV